MTKAILAEKLGMTQLMREDVMIPVTVLKAGPCVVTQLKVMERDGYEAVQLGFREAKPRKTNQPMVGHFKKANCPPQKFVAEVALSPSDYKTGQKIKCDIFAEGDRTDISGVSKGKGTAGVIKRHGFKGGPAGHGSRFHRAPGAIGQCATPSRVFKGKKLPGRMGAAHVTSQNLLVVGVDKDRDLLLVRGAVPGPRGSVVVIKESVKGKKKARRR